LSSLTSIAGFLTITDNDKVPSFCPLSNLRFVGDVVDLASIASKCIPKMPIDSSNNNCNCPL